MGEANRCRCAAHVTLDEKHQRHIVQRGEEHTEEQRDRDRAGHPMPDQVPQATADRHS